MEQQNGLATKTKSLDQVAADLNVVLLTGNLSGLSAPQKTQYYNRVCELVGLNPLTKPFEYIAFQGKEVLYAGKNCAEQLRQIYGISIEIISREIVGDLLVVTARAKSRDGRVDESIGALSVGTAKGEQLANAMMKTETKAKRRVTLSICGLGMLDETEVESIKATEPLSMTPPEGAVVVVTEPEPPKMIAQYDISTLDQAKKNAAVNLLRASGATTEDELGMFWDSPVIIERLAKFKLEDK